MLYRDAFPILNGIYVMPFFLGSCQYAQIPKKNLMGGTLVLFFA